MGGVAIQLIESHEADNNQKQINAEQLMCHDSTDNLINPIRGHLFGAANTLTNDGNEL